MKRVYIVRHAKSSWADLSMRDIERPLNPRGNRDAPRIAQFISDRTPVIDLLLCSTSQRTRETAAHFDNHISFTKVEYKEKIYHAPYTDIVDVIIGIPSEVSWAMVIGHNPGSTDLYNHFASSYLDNLPTCGAFLLSIDGAWEDIDQQNTKVSQLVYPKML